MVFRKIFLAVMTPIILLINAAVIWFLVDAVRDSTEANKGNLTTAACIGIIVLGVLSLATILSAWGGSNVAVD